MKRYEPAKAGGSRKPLLLHARIQLLAQKQPELANFIMAVKWIGNAGSHASSIARDDALDGFKILDHVLTKVFVSDDEDIKRLQKKINKKKGPISK